MKNGVSTSLELVPWASLDLSGVFFIMPEHSTFILIRLLSESCLPELLSLVDLSSSAYVLEGSTCTSYRFFKLLSFYLTLFMHFFLKNQCYILRADLCKTYIENLFLLNFLICITNWSSIFTSWDHRDDLGHNLSLGL